MKLLYKIKLNMELEITFMLEWSNRWNLLQQRLSTFFDF
jgi:hypothetical protein